MAGRSEIAKVPIGPRIPEAPSGSWHRWNIPGVGRRSLGSVLGSLENPGAALGRGGADPEGSLASSQIPKFLGTSCWEKHFLEFRGASTRGKPGWEEQEYQSRQHSTGKAGKHPWDIPGFAGMGFSPCRAEGVFGIRPGLGTSGKFLPCLEPGGAGKPSFIPEFLREFLDVDYKSSGFPARNAHPHPSLPDFSRSFPLALRCSRFSRRFPLLPSSRSVAFCMRRLQHDRSAR